MTTTIPAGLGATLGVAAEGTVGVFNAPTRSLLIEPNEGFGYKKNVLQTKVLNGQVTLRKDQRVVPTHEGTGKLSMNVLDASMGLLFQNIFGSSTNASTSGGSGAAFTQVHQISTVAGQSLSFQKGVPEIPSGSVNAYDYNGGKITEATFSLKSGEQLKLDLTLDLWNEQYDGTYAVPGFTSHHVYHFGDTGGIKLGGSASTTDGVVSVSGGAAPVGLIRSWEMKIARKLDTKRYNVGDSTKHEQLENDYLEVTGSMEMEYANQADFYNDFKLDNGVCMELTLAQPTAISGSVFPTFDIICPSISYEEGSPMVTSPGMIIVKANYTALDDGTNNICQLSYTTSDTSY